MAQGVVLSIQTKSGRKSSKREGQRDGRTGYDSLEVAPFVSSPSSKAIVDGGTSRLDLIINSDPSPCEKITSAKLQSVDLMRIEDQEHTMGPLKQTATRKMASHDASNLVQSFGASPDKAGSEADGEARQLDPGTIRIKIVSEV